MTTETVRHTFCGGKYEYVRQPSFRAHVYRHGEEWRDVTGDGLILAMVQRIEELEDVLRDVRQHAGSGVCCCGDSMENHPSPMECGHSPRDTIDYYIEGHLSADIDGDF